ncbi:hypothetical protein BV25DRAFT_1043667 [Artomyces pyxidatus]|uniref:Uncharacterized protein n=1 Tax=Artomyces pyxidatus TaxID=48021 RepID=A0ACB8STK8_9AGAM|nr:hypothetical protein BV25DRAFT_1043667 [Artomyces pyxidatus]
MALITRRRPRFSFILAFTIYPSSAQKAFSSYPSSIQWTPSPLTSPPRPPSTSLLSAIRGLARETRAVFHALSLDFYKACPRPVSRFPLPVINQEFFCRYLASQSFKAFFAPFVQAFRWRGSRGSLASLSLLLM